MKPGGTFVGYDWFLTDQYDSQNTEHVLAKRLIEEGDALPELKSTHQLVADLENVGFNVVVNLSATKGIADETVQQAIQQMQRAGISLAANIEELKLQLNA